MKILTSRRVFSLIVIFLALPLVAYAVANFDLRARQMPSRLETVIATTVKHWLIAWAVYREPPSPPFEALENPPGQMLFMACCSTMLRAIATSVEGSPGHCSIGGLTHNDNSHSMGGTGTKT